MDGRVDDEPDFWMEEPEELPSFPMKKRKVRTKKMEFVGWGSKPLIEFLESIGKDTSKQISQYEVAAIIDEFVKTNNLTHPQKKKRIICDERLYSLFGRKSVGRIKIYDLLETHFAENQDESEDDFFYSSEENDEKTMSKQKKALSSDKKNLPQRKKVLETPKSCFAAITSANLKLVYLKRSLVQDLLKDPETFEGKVVGSFVRVKSDPNDYFQKNSHQLLQVTGVTKASGPDNTGIEILLQVSNWMQDIRICMLSDVDFSEEECEDLHERVKSGSLKRPTVVEFQQKAEMLHEDITKHWLVRELNLLQNLIDRANEKGWRKELFEYLERKELLQTPAEQTKLLVEVPKVIADEIEQEVTPQEGSHGSPRSTPGEASDISANDSEANKALSTKNFDVTDAAESADEVIASKVILHDSSLAKEQNCDSISVETSNREAEENQHAQCERTQSLNLEESKDSWGRFDKHVVPAEVVELSDDDEEVEDSGGGGQITGDHPRSMWHYVDPRGDVQGPFSIELLKRWRDANYFPPDFKVWKPGQSQDEAVFLSDVLLQTFPNSLQLREYI